MIEDCDLPVTILRPNYFIQNDTSMKDALLGQGIYPQPIGSKGISMVDTRDIGEVAALFLLKRKKPPSSAGDPSNWSIPKTPAEEILCRIWSEVLGRQIRYGGNDLAAFEKLFGTFAPRWMARDLRLMMSRFQRQGMVAKPEAVARLTDLLGHTPRSYRDFAAETAKQW